ncbi:MAG: 6-carboxytetrahydropterin synthase QueD [Bacteroidales bacterium]|nr:6-carboxytetrahydropterin synthase QueD [Bacteroidales bacterium]
MVKIRITKEFIFDAAHILPQYDGKCHNIHGHTYKLQVTLKGTPCEDEKSSKCGMVMDFGILKKAVKEPIVDRFDHSVIVPCGGRFDCMKEYQEEGKFIEIPCQPTCENLTAYIAQEIKKHLPCDVELFSVRLFETPTSYAEWYAEDNE